MRATVGLTVASASDSAATAGISRTARLCAPWWDGRMHRMVGLGALAMAFAMLGGCSDAQPGAASPGLTVRLVIPDGNIRPPDVPCTGAGGFRYAHPEAPYVIENAAGRVVASGSLPQGTSEPAWNIDLGDRRQPTICVMMLEVPGLTSIDRYRLAIDGRPAKPIRPNRNLDNIPEVMLS
jgi:hypothetical protein